MPISSRSRRRTVINRNVYSKLVIVPGVPADCVSRPPSMPSRSSRVGYRAAPGGDGERARRGAARMGGSVTGERANCIWSPSSATGSMSEIMMGISRGVVILDIAPALAP